MRCLYCGKPLPLLKKLTGGGEFCSDAHRNKYQEEYNKLALSRLLQAQTPNAAVSGNLSPRALRQLPPPAPRAGAPRALPPPSAPSAAETKKGGFAGLFSSRKPAALEAPAPSAPTTVAPPALRPVPGAAEAAAPTPKSSIWKTFVRAERPAPPPPPEPDPAEASFLLARVEVRKPLGKTLMAPIVIDPVFLEEVPRPAGASAVVSLVEPVPFDWDEAFLQYCCDSEVEVAAVEEPAVSPAAEVELVAQELVAQEEDAIAASEEVGVSATVEESEVEAASSAEVIAEPLAELPAEEVLAEAESTDQDEPILAQPPAEEEEAAFANPPTEEEEPTFANPPTQEEEPAFSEPPMAGPIVSSPVSVAPPPPFAVLGAEPELAFVGLVLYPTCVEVDLGSPRPTPVREKILEPLSFGGATLPAARPRSFIARIGSRPAQSSYGWHPGTPWQSWRPSLQFVPPPPPVRPVATAPLATRQAPPPPPPPAAQSEQHHEVVINLAALGILGDE